MKRFIILQIILCLALYLYCGMVSALPAATNHDLAKAEDLNSVKNISARFITGLFPVSTFAEARSACANLGMNLIYIDSAQKQSDVQEFMYQNSLHFKMFYTSGMRYSMDQFMWTTTGEMVDYTNWYIWEPNEPEETKDVCLILYSVDIDYKWVDVDCNGWEYFYYMCELYPPQ